MEIAKKYLDIHFEEVNVNRLSGLQYSMNCNCNCNCDGSSNCNCNCNCSSSEITAGY